MVLWDKQARWGLLIALIGLSCSIVINASSPQRRFPNDFLWGVGTSSYQIEGGWNADDKGESIWDYMTHQFPEKIDDESNADISCDSYHHWRQDVQMVRQLNVNIYRFSISWPRILPTGHMNHVSNKGIEYYSNLIDELLKYNITPMVTIYHFDLPQRLQELGGWTNPEIVPVFKDYAQLLFDTYGDRVKIWTTFNEAFSLCEYGYGLDYLAPAYNYPGIPGYLCGHNLLKAHAEVVHMYRNNYQAHQKGKIGIVLYFPWQEAKTNSAEDKAASERAIQFYLGWFAHPIFSERGNYPQVMIDRIAGMSKEQGFTKSRLPEFTPEEIDWIRGTSDYFGLNSYTTNLLSNNGHNNSANFRVPSLNHDMGVIEEQDPNWPGSGSPWLKVVPFGMYKLLMWIKREYNNPPVMVTENGVSDDGRLNDYNRVDYFNSYLTSVLDAIEEGANIKGYIAWSLMDNYEWKAGFTQKFGLFHVDFTHPDRIRTAKASAKVFAKICKTNLIDWDYRPEADRPEADRPQANRPEADRPEADPIVNANDRNSAHFSTLCYSMLLAMVFVKLLRR